MKSTLRQLAALVRGTLDGDGELVVQSACPLQEAQPGDITFLDRKSGAPLLAQSRATAAIVPADFVLTGKALIRVADPLLAFAAVFRFLKGKTAPQPTGIDPRALVHDSAHIGADASIHAGAAVGADTVIGKRCRLHTGVVVGKNCRLGDGVTLYPNAVLYDDTVLGDRVTIHAGAILGADGFGYRFHEGQHVKVPQLGNVVVGNDVEIGAGSTIDRGTFQATTIGAGTKLDNMVHIAHNCKIGKHNIYAAQVGVAGSCEIGDYVVMGGQVGVKDHIKVGDGAVLGAKAGVIVDVAAGSRHFLYPSHEDREAARIVACLKRLPEMRKDLLRVLKELHLSDEREETPTRSAETPAE